VTGNKVPFSLKKAIHGPHVGVVYSRAAPAAAARAGALPNEEFTGSLAKVRLLLLFLKLPLSSSTALCGLRDIWGNHHHRAAGRHGAPGHRRRRQGRRAVRGRAQDTPTGFAIFDSIGRLRIVSFFLSRQAGRKNVQFQQPAWRLNREPEPPAAVRYQVVLPVLDRIPQGEERMS
jgi:hypothetical protein